MIIKKYLVREYLLLRHLEFIIEQGHRVNWVSGLLDSRVTGSLGHKMWPSSISGLRGSQPSLINGRDAPPVSKGQSPPAGERSAWRLVTVPVPDVARPFT